jgi:SAM-dependent methyltransferase
MTSPSGYPAAFATHYDQDNQILRGGAGDVAFYRDLALAAGGPTLEIAAGNGRVVLPLAEAGVEVVAVEPSAAMRADLERKRAAAPADVAARIAVRDGHFGAVSHPGGFGLVFSAFRAFQHLITREEQAAALAEMARLVAPGGRVAFDTFDFDPERAPTEETDHVDYVLDVDGVRHERVCRGRVDREAGVIHVGFRWLVDGALTDAGEIDLKIFTRDQLVDLATGAGLEVEAVYRDFHGAPWTPGDAGEIVLVARRPTP